MLPIRFYQRAERLMTSEQNPEGFRTCVSRAYYAAFLTARDFLATFGIRFSASAASVHTEVRDILANTADLELVKAGSMLGDLRSHRNRVDYHLDDKDLEKDGYATLRLAEASDIMAKIGTCMSNATRHKVVEGAARTYAQGIRKMQVS